MATGTIRLARFTPFSSYYLGLGVFLATAAAIADPRSAATWIADALLPAVESRGSTVPTPAAALSGVPTIAPPAPDAQPTAMPAPTPALEAHLVPPISLAPAEILSDPPLPILPGATWDYSKGTSAPDAAWNTLGFSPVGWLSGASGFGYGDADDNTVLSDMANTYTSVFIRRGFDVPNLSAVGSLTLTIDYDDAFVAYINGAEVARSASMGGTVGVPPTYTATAATSREASAGGGPAAEVFTIPVSAVVQGSNVIAIQGHNQALSSTDFSLIPKLEAVAPPNPPPSQPTNPSPADGATGVVTNPQLCVDVSDPNGDPLTVTFKGRQGGGGTGLPFTVIAMPDTQYYSESFPTTYQAQTMWVRDNRIARNIVMSIGLGDCVNVADVQAQWTNANAANSILENPVTTGLTDGIPYGIAVGNHDQAPNGNARTGADENITTLLYNQTFPKSRFQGRAYFGGQYPLPGFTESMDNHYELFSASGMDFIVFHLEWDDGNCSWPADGSVPTGTLSTCQNVMSWMRNLLVNTYPNRRAIIASHFVGTPSSGGSGTMSLSNQGQAYLNMAKALPNVFMMLGGHLDQTNFRQDTANDGHKIFTIVTDYQTRPNGGNGWLRIMTFDPTADTIHIETYSPTVGGGRFINRPTSHADDLPSATPIADPNAICSSTRTNSCNELLIPYNMDAGLPFQTIGSNTNVLSGSRTCVTWSGLPADQLHEWKVEVSDGTSTTDPIWSFTTSSCNVDADCNDSDPCTTDTCPAGTCSNVAIAGCCTTDAQCADATVCTTDTCNTGSNTCVHANNALSCSDGSACTTSDVCTGGACVGGAAPNCNDANACTNDSCIPATGCVHAYAPSNGCCATSADCNDGNAGTTDTCVGPPNGTCSNAANTACTTVADCNDSDACTTDTCVGGNVAALQFDGTNDYVDLGNAAALTNFGIGSFTVEGWVYTDGGNADRTGVIRIGRQGDFMQVAVQLTGTAAPFLALAGSVESDGTGGQQDVNYQGSTITPNAWHHFALIVDRTSLPGNPAGQELRLHVDGGPAIVANASIWSTNTMSTTDNVVFGAARLDTGALGNYYDGRLDEVRIWSGVRTPTEIQNNMNLEITSAPGLLHRWGLNDQTSPTLDSVGTSHGTLTNGPVWLSLTSQIPALGPGICSHTAIPSCTPCSSAAQCDDADGCTTDTCPAGACVHAAVSCDDSDACTTDACSAGSCTHAPLNCSDGDQCTADTCSAGVCQHAPTPGAACDDGNSATCNDVCASSTVTSRVPNEAVEDCLGTTSVTFAAGQTTPGFTAVNVTWTHTYTPIVAPIVSATLTVDIGDADGYVMALLSQSSTPIGTITGGDNGGPGTFACPNAWAGGADNVINIPSSLFADLADGSFQVSTTGGGISPPGQYGINRSILQIQTAACAGTSVGCCVVDGDCNDGDPCTVDSCGGGTCNHVAGNNGASCNDGNACTQTDTCQAGVCSGANPIVCVASDQCHDVGTCNPTTGQCTDPAKTNGTSCDDGALCTTGDSCQSGVCDGTALVCTASDQCHVAGTCNPVTGLCSNPEAANGTGCNDANLCTTGDVCTAGVCAGNAINCDDGNQCTADTCSAGSCVHTSTPGASCNDGSVCTTGDVCVGGNVTSVVGTQTCTESQALSWNGTTAWITVDKAWTHSYAAIGGTIVGATLAVEIGDADSGPLTIVSGATTIGIITGGDNGGPGTFGCIAPGFTDNVLTIPPSLYADLADGTFQVSTSGCGTACPGAPTGPGTYSLSRAILTIQVAPTCAGATVPGCCVIDAECADSSPCTVDTCVANACVHNPGNNGATCDDGNSCTAGDVCAGGTCAGTTNTALCDDSNSCTTDSCAGASANTALSFDGVDDYVDFGNDASLVNFGTSSFTVEGWIYTDGGANDRTGIFRYGQQGAHPQVVVQLSGTAPFRNLTASVETNAAGQVDTPITNPATLVPVNTWTHFAMVVDRDSLPSLPANQILRLYIDGTEVSTVSGSAWASNVINAPDAVVLGAARLDGGALGLYYDGRMDEVRIWSGARSQTLIQNNMNRQISSASGLLHRWGMNEGTGSTAFHNPSPGVSDGLLKPTPPGNQPTWVAGVPALTSYVCSNAVVTNGTTCTDDGNPCTTDTCTAGACGHAAGNNGASCDDGTLCTTGDVCGGGTCAGTAINCDDGLPCTVDSCSGGACQHVTNPNCCASDAECNDANACTLDICPTSTNVAALQFDGTNDYVTMGAAPTLGATSFTIETWFKKTGAGSAATTGVDAPGTAANPPLQAGCTAIPLVTKGRNAGIEGTNADVNYFLGIQPVGSGACSTNGYACTNIGSVCVAPGTGTCNSVPNKLCADFESTEVATNNYPINGKTQIRDNQWYHAAVTYDQVTSTWKMYLNGNLEAVRVTGLPGTKTPRSDSANHFALGSALDTAGAAAGFFAGQLDETRVWSRALTQSEIQSGMNRPITSGTGLLGRWGLNDGSGPAAADSTSPSETGTLTNGPTWPTTGLPNLGSTSICQHVLPSSPGPGCCVTAADCDDNNACTTDACQNGACSNAAIANCCLSDAACDDSNACTIDSCTSANTRALVFNGSASQYVTMNVAPALGSTAFTLELMFRRDGPGTETTSGTGGQLHIVPLVAKGRGEADGTNVDCGYLFGIDVTTAGANHLAADFESTDGSLASPLVLNNFPVTSTATIAATTGWRHAAATYDGRCWTLFLDNGATNLDVVGSSCPGRTPRFDTTQYFAIGSALTSTGAAAGGFAGAIDEVRVWSRALTETELEANMNAQLTSGTGLIGRWGLNDAASPALDSDPNGDGVFINGTWTGAVTPITTGLPFLGGGTCAHAPTTSGSACSDGNACTAGDACDGAGLCVGTALTCNTPPNDCYNAAGTCTAGTCNYTPKTSGSACSDGNACTTSDACDGAGLCVGTALTCNTPPNDCYNAAGTCTAGTCTYTPKTSGASCDDSNACTTGDACNGAGLCVGTALTCNTPPNDCYNATGTCTAGTCNYTPKTSGASCDDSNACTTGDACDGAGLCVGTALTCNTPPNDCYNAAGTCTAGTCNYTPKTSGASCDDSNACTTGDACDGAGLCVGAALTCNTPPNDCYNAEGTCTAGTCNYTPKTSGASCDDSNACTTGDACDGAGLCVGTALTCNTPPNDCYNAAGTCTAGTCNYTPKTSGSACSDGNACTTSDACDGAGLCVGTALTCNTPPNDCYNAAGTCTAGTCTYTPKTSGASCDDSNACTTGDACDGAGLCVGTALTCNTPPNDCYNAAGTCTAGTCTYTPKTSGASCDDSNACTTGDACDGAGLCVGTALTCNTPPNDCYNAAGTCTAGTCNYTPKTSGASCDDSNACTTGDACDGAGLCVGTALTCNTPPNDCYNAAGTCTAGTCNYTPKTSGATCNDGNACTTGDACDGAGLCVGMALTCNTPPNDCYNAAGTCTAGTCNYTPKTSGATCNDGNACTTGDACDGAGLCVGTALTCNTPPNDCYNAAGTCTAGTCNYTPKTSGASCDDSNACTTGDACDGAGLCVGTALTCNTPPNDCYNAAGTCTAGTCTYTPKTSGATCDDSNACTTGDACNGAGSCVGTGVTCTTPPGQCYEAVGTCSNDLCTYAPKTSGATCDDGNACTTSDTCDGAGLCVGTALTCNAPPNDCYNAAGTCTAGTCNYTPKTSGASCDDSNACTTGDACDGAGLCVGTALTCNTPPNDCYNAAGTCTAGTCNYTPKTSGSACSDGNACTTSDACDGAGLCVGTALTCNTPPNDCYNAAGTCTAGTCNYTPKTSGSACSDGNACTTSDACDGAGLCVGTALTCNTPPNDCYNAAGTCTAGTCNYTPKTSGSACSDGNACTTSDACDGAGLCVGTALTCNTPPNGCYNAAGTCTAGTCNYTPKTSGASCDDSNACTTGDACDGAGLCVGTALTCNTPPNDCYNAAGTCTAGTCTYTPKTGGTTCNDGNACTTGDACDGAGVCVGTALVCNTPPNDCYNAAGTCSGGTCTYTPKSSGATCNDGNACTTGDVCDGAGVCAGAGSPDVCDGVDNDCNPLTPDGSADPGVGVTCDGPDSDLCAEGTTSCTGGAIACSDATGSTLDLCNGLDDDCDGASADGSEDPGVGVTCDGPDSDLCAEGTTSCTGGAIACSDATGSTLDLCNGLNDDCDGASADGSEDPGVGVTCDGPDSDLCAEGTTSCTGGAIACSDATGSTLDLCNGLDDDCDGASADGSEDPGVGVACDGPDSDLCAEGTTSCTGGAIACSDATGSTLDLCNGLNDDCDGASADGSEDPGVGVACDGPDSDLCAEGTTSCAGGAIACSDATGSTLDLCNGLDDDCDGASADGSEDPGVGVTCDGPDSDLCAEGTTSCSGGAIACSDATGSTLDLCNGLDDDCDGASADGSEDTGVGVTCDGPDSDLCAEGTTSCTGGAIACSDATGSTLDLCNGLDDDCDGASADGSEDTGVGVACDGPDTDLCAEGTTTCTGGAIACSDATGNSVELCDGLDNNCNGSVDENPLVLCNDSSVCTTDSCNGVTGCSHTNITCNDSNLCTTDTCVAATGCAFTPVTCGAGSACNPGNGLCEPTTAPPLPIVVGDTWRYFKGTGEPAPPPNPPAWAAIAYNDTGWLTGPSGFGYGADGCMAQVGTTLPDMPSSPTPPGYFSIYARRTFNIVNPAAVTSLTAVVDFDDSVVVYVNGTEVGRSTSMGGTTGTPTAFNTPAASGHECSVCDTAACNPAQSFPVSPGLLVAGTNVIAIHAHNQSLTSSDFILIPTVSATLAQCTVNADCNDSVACTTDTCNASVCQHASNCTGGQTCNVGSGLCETAPVTATFQDGVGGYGGTQDTYLAAAAATTVEGALDNWRWDTENPAPSAEFGLIRFDSIIGSGPGQIPAGSTITSATLTLEVSNGSVTPNGNINESAVDWSEATATWNNFGGEADVQADEYLASPAYVAPIAAGSANITVTSSVQAWASALRSNFGWVFRPANNDGVQVDSAEFATIALRPKLTVVYVPTTTSCTINADCSDNNVCNGIETCAANVCQPGTALGCDDANVCTTDSCDALLGCQHANNTLTCNDANACTSGDVCGAGICSGTAISCNDGVACTADSCDSGTGCQHVSTCTGGQTCNLTSGICEALPTTVTFQQGVSGYSGAIDTFVHAGLPTTDNGAAVTLIVDGPPPAADERQILLRFDNLFVSQGGPIPNGASISSATLQLDITNPSADGAELHRMLVPWTASSTWNSLTNGVQRDGVESVAAADVSSLWNGAVPTLHTIDVTSSLAAWSAGGVKQGWVFVTPGAGFDSWQFDSSEATTLANRPKLTVLYTTPTGCTANGQCDDGNACNGAETCVATVCQPGTTLVCNDNNVCTTDTCVAPSGCVFTNNTATCNDNNACTTADTCSGGSCVGGPALVCNDNNVCTTDTCAAGSGCGFTNNTATCNDNNACTTTDTCSGGSCVGGGALVCNDSNVCTTDTCAAGSGCVFTNNTATCNDNNACTTTDTCSGGSCVGGPALVCNDGNVCTTDSCNSASGCETTPITGGGTTTCGTGVCQVTVTNCIAGVSQTCTPGPASTEVCDGLDNNCNGSTDENGAAMCADDNTCNGTEICGGASGCQAGTPPVVASTISIPDVVTGQAGGTVSVPVLAQAAAGIGIDLSVTYDPAVLQPTSVVKSLITQGGTLTFNLATPGVVKVSIFATEAFTGSGPIAFVNFNVVGAVGTGSPLGLTRADINEGAISTCRNGGGFTACGGPNAAVSGVTVNGKTSTTIAWTLLGGGIRYDVASGSLTTLHADRSTIAASCLVNDATILPVVDGRAPSAGDGYYYLVRPQDACAIGSYGQASNGDERWPAAACP